MKTMTPKNAVKLLLFLLILFSAKAFSFTKLPTELSSSGSGSKFGSSGKVSTAPRATSNSNAIAYKGNALQSKNKRFKK
ncbi:hypothetical protein [Flavobacterium sp.]|jgi:hypothetical protein|uniref:hypothetical protein n=1 Tax=Flavobacterium sp. TaxID=239 RepID=UPI0037BF8E8C